MSKHAHKILAFIFSLTFVFCSVKSISYFYHSYKSKNSYDEIRDIYDISQAVSTYEPEILSIDSSSSVDDLENIERQKLFLRSTLRAKKEEEEEQRLREQKFIKLQKINKDIISWVYIPNTKIDYPVVKGIDNEFYLSHDAVKKPSEVGAIFMDFNNRAKNSLKNTDNNIVLYGHNMKNGTMFKDLTKFKDMNFLNENKYIYLDTPSGRLKWEIFSVFVTKSDFNYRQIKFGSSSEFSKFLSTVMRKSMVTTNIKPSAKDQILTLSTCSYEFADARLAVMARLVD